MHAIFAQEFEALVGRAARQGRLDAYDLLDTYVELAPSGHPDLANPRKLDVQALVTALSGLPRELIGAPRVFVVPRLGGFSHTPVESPSYSAGLLNDGTLLLEARFGMLSLLGLAGTVCALAHELDKVRQLVPQSEEDLFPSEPEPESEVEPLVQLNAHKRRPSDEEEAAFDEDEGGDDNEADYEAEGDEATRVEAGGERDVAAQAFALGLDERTLLEADAACGGLLLAVLAPDFELPEISLHADLGKLQTQKRAIANMDRIVAALAEMGLAGRPLHVWIGSAVLSDCLSPYTRELRNELLGWAAENPQLLGEDVDLEVAPAGEDLLYALAADFLASDARLADERLEADRSVGIQRQEVDGLPFEIIDLGRVDASVCDARLTPWTDLESAPVVLRLVPDLEDSGGYGLTRLFSHLAGSMKSVSLVLDGTALDAVPGTVFLPDVLVRWASGQLIAVPAGVRWQASELAGLSDAVVTGGAVLSAPHANLLSTQHMGELGRRFAVHAIEVGGAGMLNALAEAVWAGQIGPEVDLSWAVVGSHYTRTGRASLQTLTGQSALAVLRLRQILAAAAPPPPVRKERPRPTGGSGRAVRIKA